MTSDLPPQDVKKLYTHALHTEQFGTREDGSTYERFGIVFVEDYERLKAEHERSLKALLDKINRGSLDYSRGHEEGLLHGREEVVRIKKELEDNTNQWMEHSNKAFLDGERRAMQRVKETLTLLCERYKDRHAPDSLNDLKLAMFRLGLSDKEVSQ